MKTMNISTKKTYILPTNDIATICDVYSGVQFDIPKAKIIPLFISGMFGNEKNYLSSVIVNGERKWGLIDKA